MSQITNSILMIRPASFRKNEQTAINNYYQADIDLENQKINLLAQKEFDAFVVVLKSHQINVIVVDDVEENNTPDALFPNNWISFHDDGTATLYPMFAENRRRERREDILDILETKGFEISNVMDYTSAEEASVFLEGTGSIILDRENKIAYCALSPRAEEELFIEFCEDFEYTPVIFTAYQTVDNKRVPIYHTNVMMCLGTRFAVICLDAIDDKDERKNLIKHLKNTKKQIIELTEEQVSNFAGNMLQLKNSDNQQFVVMSTSAHAVLSPNQLRELAKHGTLLFSDLTTIETCGGGSARCMMAEIFLPHQS